MSRHIRGLDALRGVAVLAVVAYHAGTPGFSGGFLGVSLFFTLSGFLITSLMLREMTTGRVDLRNFWRRRIRRLLPAAVAVVALVVVAAGFGLFGLHQAIVDGFWAVTDGANWHELASGQSYSALFSAPSPLLHYWSLAIEEQYYLAFPIVCWWCARRRNPRAVLTGALCGVLAISLHAHLSGWGVNRMYYGTDVRVGEIALGGLLAVAADRFRLLEAPSAPLRKAISIMQIPALLFAAWCVASTTETSPWLFHGGLLLFGMCSMVLVLGAALEVGVLRRLARSRPLVGLGVISYGVYLVHWPLLVALHPFHNTVRDTTVAIVATLAIAALSYRYFEQPIRRGTAPRLTRRLALVPVGALVVVSLVAGMSAAWPQHDATAAVAATAPSQSANSSASRAPELHRLRVLVIGDSTGDELGKLMAKLTKNDPRIVVRAQAVGGCPLVDAHYQRMVADFDWGGPKEPYCRHWAERLKAQESFAPDVVLSVFGPTQQSDVKLDGSDHGTNILNADEQAATRAEVAALHADFPHATFVWANAPRVFAGTTAFPESRWVTNRVDRNNVWNVMVVEFAAQPHSSMIDLKSFVESAPGGWHDRTWRPDGTHMKGAALQREATWMIDQLLAKR